MGNMVCEKTLAMLYIYEVGLEVNERNGKERAVTIACTWCTGVRINDTLYVTQCSCGDLLDDDEVLVVHTSNCTKTHHAPEYASFDAYSFTTEPDVLPSECHELKIVSFDDLTPDIQDAIWASLEIYGNCRVGA